MGASNNTRRWPSWSSVLGLVFISCHHLAFGYSDNYHPLHDARHGHPEHHARATNKSAADDVSFLSNTAVTGLMGQLGTANSLAAAADDDYTCGPGKDCSNGACCGVDGWCGYGPKYCGDGCQSNCDAKAACGEYAEEPGTTCPLNVCCSEFGFCGTTEDFCKDGCQSNCEQPKPDTGGSNTQTRVIGYWETWNLDHPCGTMNPSEIPVQALTHLNIAFGYIDKDFRVTNMDGISTNMYRSAANLKSRNPNLKVMIALGGWTFSDPGPWQDIFPSLAASPENRATFITNLLGFLSEYGYDGVDFDWEYPGADDRGGSEGDGENFTALVKELREAIDASGHEYLVTFTAPSSYWYLRHFDLKNMEAYVDWINLMSYDLHGTWDSSNPIGNQVLAHTNLTEIDLALNLFWRVDIDPAKIVLGLGFYGRSFELESTSCWKPGCKFSGPGAAGQCTNTPGILSYREIMSVLAKTGAKAHFDEEAAVKYLVYGGNSWISYDDADTFQLKIDYANKMGLGGLMVWAIDQDDDRLTALSAVTDSSLASDDRVPFTLVDLKKLFPKEDLPPEDTSPRYGLVNFGGDANLGETDPSKTGFGFFLVAGESHAVSKLRRREGEPEPFTFLDCPTDVMSQPDDKVQTARVVCLNEDVEGCFRVMERGVEGTVVEMPENCASDTFARAVSLNASDDQSLPSHLEGKATSAVFDFSFDYNFKLVRKDTEKTSIRLDYASIPGYWNGLVDSDGVQSSGGERLKERFFSEEELDWNEKFGALSLRQRQQIKVKEDLTQPMYWDSINGCSVNGELFAEGLGAYMEGGIETQFEYGFTLLSYIQDGELHVTQTAGMLFAEGEIDLNFVIGGIGKFDVAKAHNDNPAWYKGENQPLQGQTVYASGMKGWASYKPYIKVDYMLATRNGEGGSYVDSEVGFNGLLGARMKSSVGPIVGTFPIINGSSSDKPSLKISIPKSNIIYGNGPGLDVATIALSCYVSLGIDVDFGVMDGDSEINFEGPDISLRFENTVQFTNDGSEGDGAGTCVDYVASSTTRVQVRDGGTVGFPWPENDFYTAQSEAISPSDEALCYPNAETKRWLSERDEGWKPNENYADLAARADGKLPGWGWAAGAALVPGMIFKGSDFSRGAPIIEKFDEKIRCKECMTCTQLGDEDEDGCCGCICMDLIWGFSDIPACEECNGPDVGVWPSGAGATRTSEALPVKGRREYDEDYLKDDGKDEYGLVPRQVAAAVSVAGKPFTVCGKKSHTKNRYRYPPFPANAAQPWDGIDSGKWDPISRYWGNASEICSVWDVDAFQPADKVDIGQGPVRANYQTEHVFEAQLISDFFSRWLDKGSINGQVPDPVNPAMKFSCTQTEEHVLTDLNWNTPGLGIDSFIHYLMAEIGSEARLDRLTIYMARPNRMKGSMFRGFRAVAQSSFTAMSAEEQILAMKEMGMNFSYLNNPEVWDMFCASYEGVYDKMGEFDEWYTSNIGPGSFNFQEEWKDYIRVVLDSLVERTRSDLDLYHSLRKLDRNYEFHWTYNMLVNRNKIKFEHVCSDMDAPAI